MKRIICLLLVFVLSCASILPVSAAEDPGIAPCFTYIHSTATSLTIDARTRIANCYAKCQTYSDNLTIKIVGTLQQYDSKWTNVYSWTVTGSGGIVILDRLRAVPKGYNYRLVANYYIYNSAGTFLESSVATHYCNFP